VTYLSKAVKEKIEYYLNEGLTDKQDIFHKVIADLNVSRPTVRKIARDLRTEYLKKIQILQGDSH